MTTERDAQSTTSVMLRTPRSLHALAKLYAASNRLGVADVYHLALRAFLVGRTDAKGKAAAGTVAASDEIKGEVDRLVALSREIVAEGRPRK